MQVPAGGGGYQAGIQYLGSVVQWLQVTGSGLGIHGQHLTYLCLNGYFAPYDFL